MKSKILLGVLLLLFLLAIPLPAMARAPTADFYADKTYGSAPLHVNFYSTDVTGDPTSYFWKFEHETSSDWNSHHFGSAVHTFRHPGVYDVSLTVSNADGSTTKTKSSYITVKE
uniref:Cell surface protein n=1 Tax=Methanosarcina barkeri (strain Fusaro / DSM 804) TaxID=269797 RepID=Q468E0_METBF